MAKYNIFYGRGDRVRIVRGDYYGRYGTILGPHKRSFLQDDSFPVILDSIDTLPEYPMEFASWDLESA